jgi:phosphopantetheinyl transferase
MFFSTSHSNDMIVIAIDSKKVAVDIEYIRPRHE